VSAWPRPCVLTFRTRSSQYPQHYRPKTVQTAVKDLFLTLHLTSPCNFYWLWNICYRMMSVLYRGEQKSTPVTFVGISAVRANFCMKFHTTIKQSNIHFTIKFGWTKSEDDKIQLFQARQPSFLSVWASCRTGWKRTGSLRRMSGPQAL